MRDHCSLLAGLFAVLLSAQSLAQGTGAARLDPVFTKDGNGNFLIPKTGGVSFASGVDLVAADRSLVSIVTTGTGVTVSRYESHEDGSPNYENPTFGVNLPYDITNVVVVNGVIVLVGTITVAPGVRAIIVVMLDAKTGTPPPDLKNPFLYFSPYSDDDSDIAPFDAIIYGLYFPPAPGQDAARVSGKAGASTPLVAIFAMASNKAYTDFRSGVYLLDPATGKLVPGFGTGGYAFAQGNFFGRWGAATANGLVIGGVSRLDPARPGIGIANFDVQGKPGSCGSAMKELLPRTSTFVLPDTTGGFFDPGSGLVTFVGEANGTQFFGRQLKSDCTLIATAFTYPNKVFAGGVAGVTAQTMAAVVNETGNGTLAARVALYPIATGGAPSAVSPVITSASVAASGSADGGGAKAVSVANTTASSIMIQPDAKIVIGGTTDALGGKAFAARYIGVEVTTSVVEFFNTTLKHYFITADPNEAAAIDAGSAGPGWSRTGQTWKSGGPNRVCRFYGVQAAGGPNGHFYTISDAECAAVKLDPGWHFESYDFSAWPLNSAGACPAGTIPVKRVYNGRFAQHDSNHRYTTSDTIYNQMIASGWSGEGTVYCSVQ